MLAPHNMASGMAGPTGGAAAANGAPAKSMDAEVAALEARLARKGGTQADWTLLAQAYDFLGRKDDAQRARDRAASAPTPPTSPSGVAAPTGSPAAASGLRDLSSGMLALARSASQAPAQASPQPSQATAVAGGSPVVGVAQPSLTELEARVRNNPRDSEAWLAIADLQRQQHEYAKAREAFSKVIALKGMTAQGWADYADALASQAGGSLAGEPARAVDRALQMDPNNIKALWLKASFAHEQRRFAEALVLWQKLRSLLPAESSDARIIDSNIAEASALAGIPAPAPVAGPAAASGANPAATSLATASTAVEVSGTVSLDSRYASRVQKDATLFIYAKAVDSPGPPLAVMRTTASAWPVSFRLDDSMAMIPSRRLSQFDKVVIEARISRSGQAAPGPGDLYVTSDVLRPSATRKLALVINREIG